MNNDIIFIWEVTIESGAYVAMYTVKSFTQIGAINKAMYSFGTEVSARTLCEAEPTIVTCIGKERF